ncbi:MAG: ABC transporter permease [Defluviitaleaceae bacterium]|nr:ABC transporter permease [Defluviitaleaceae bacterium]
MNATKALFGKQISDFLKNMSVTIMFVMFPVIAFFMTTFMEGADAAFNVLNFTAMFIGMGPLVYVANTIAEDNEHKNLRFLIMAGVKPFQYLGGIISFAVIMCIPGMLAFWWMIDATVAQLPLFLLIGLAGCLASSMLGATVGLFAKNVQQCSAIYTPLMMVMAFTPMVAMFNPDLAVVVDFVFTRQIMLALFQMSPAVYEMADFMAEIAFLPVTLPVSLGIIGGSVLAFIIVFFAAYRKKGLKG